MFKKPTSILNGSGTDPLIDDWHSFVVALGDAINQLPVPRGRDYAGGHRDRDYIETDMHVQNLFQTLRSIEKNAHEIIKVIES
jgi:hypothetical protein